MLLILSSLKIEAQSKIDVGFIVGGGNYMGDINPSRPIYSPGLSGGLSLRYNFNPRYVLKTELSYLQLSGNDLDNSDFYRRNRNASFSTNLYDFALQFEFNFLPLKFVERKFSFSPFVSSGVGFSYNMDKSFLKSLDFVLPMAIGLRVTMSRKWSTGVQWDFRKTFNDNLDGVTNEISNAELSVLHNNDWYSLVGLFLTYKIFDFKDFCPAYPTERR